MSKIFLVDQNMKFQICTNSDQVYSNPDDDEPVINFEGVGPGRSYDGKYGYVYRSTRYGSYLDMNGNEIHREMIRDYPECGSRETPVYRKTTQQLKYLALRPGYSVDPLYDRFRYTEVQFLNFHNGKNITTVSQYFIFPHKRRYNLLILFINYYL